MFFKIKLIRFLVNKTSVATEETKIIREATSNVVSYMPKSTPTPTAKPGLTGFALNKKEPEKESRFNLNNPPQVVDASNLPSQPVKPSLFGSSQPKLAPVGTVPIGAQKALQTTINTVNKIAAAAPSPAAPIVPKLATPPPDEPPASETPIRSNLPAKPIGGSLFGSKSDNIVPNVNPFAAAAKTTVTPVVNPFASSGSNLAFGSTQKAASAFKFNTEDVASEEEEEDETGSGTVMNNNF